MSTIPATLPMSQFNGKVFVSTSHAVRERFEVPSVILADSHPFWKLWQHHLHALTQPNSLFEGVIDSLAAILLGDPLWKESTTPTDISWKRTQIRCLLINSPPNIIILKNFRHYGCHERCSPLWNYICISKSFVKLWADADEEKSERLGLSALLVTAIDHELGHWAQTIKSGYCHLSAEPMHCNLNTSELLKDDLTTDLTMDLTNDDKSAYGDEELSSDSEISQLGSDGHHGMNISPDASSSDMEDTPLAKAFQAPWMPGKGEAGNFIELSSRGGIMEYDLVVDKPYLVVGQRISDQYYLDEAYLKLYSQITGSPDNLVFRPARSHDSHQNSPYSGLKIKALNFPFGDVDGCSTQTPSPRLYQRNYHGSVPTKVHKL